MTKHPQDQINADLLSALSASQSLVAQINTLSEDNAKLRMALRKIINIGFSHSDSFERQIKEARSIAREATS